MTMGWRSLDEPAVLLLNASFEPLQLCSIKRAVTLLMCDIAERVEDGDFSLHSPSTSFTVPSVIRLKRYIRRPPRKHIAFNRRNVFRRDGHTCQYCGQVGGDLTLDHVIPRSRGGQTNWVNIVTACRNCNSRKGDRIPEEAGIVLQHQPFAPRFMLLSSYEPFFDTRWEKYL